LFRPVLWNNDNVEPWYRQNTFLFIGPLNRHLDFNAMRLHEKKIYDIVHPITLASKIEYYENLINELNNKIQKPSLRFCLSNIKRYFTTIFFKSEINKIKL
jgi:hypothetical protein